MKPKMLKAEKFSETAYRNKITYVSYAWAVMVIVLHTYNINTYVSSISDSSSYIWDITCIFENTVTSIAAMSVSGFFFLSGYLFYQNFEWHKLLAKWKSRLKTYLIPYLIWTAFPYFFYVVITHSPLHRYMNVGVVELSFKRMLQAVLTDEFNVLWFLGYLIIYTAFAPVFYLLLKNRKVPVGIVTVIILFALQSRGKLGLISIFYVLGCYIGLNYKDLLHYHHILCDRISLALLVLCVIGIAVGGKANCLSGFGVGVMIVLFWNVANYLPLNREVPWSFSISFFIYCTHSLVLESIEKVLFVFGHEYVWMPLFDYILAPVCTLAVIYLVAYILRNYCQPVWKAVTGERG